MKREWRKLLLIEGPGAPNIMPYRAKKSLGQHFLRCQWALDLIVRAAKMSQKDIVLEVGPGTGVLTRQLARHAKRVIAVEKDGALAKELSISLKKEGVLNVEIITGDILKIISSLFHKFSMEKYKLVSNIPYYLTSRLIRVVLENKTRPATIVLMVQKEVAQRIASSSPDMNLLGLSVQAYGTPKIIKTVPRTCFSPAPKVDSAIIHIENISDDFFENIKIDKGFFFKVLRQAFSHKRKTMLNALGKSVSRTDKLSALKAARVDPSRRPEELTLEEWRKIVLYMQ